MTSASDRRSCRFDVEPGHLEKPRTASRQVKAITVFVAGGSGTIGRRLVCALVAAGARVVATTRSPAKVDELARLGATPVVVDARDAADLERAVRAASPTHVVHQLTALPAARPPQ